MAYEICAEGTDSLSKNGFRQKSIILRDSDSFLDAIIKPIHEIVAAVRFRQQGSKYQIHHCPEYTVSVIVMS